MRINSILDSKGIPRSLSSKSLNKRQPGSRPLCQIVRTNDHQFIDFLCRCFQFVFK